jgi:hypothetical protein
MFSPVVAIDAPHAGIVAEARAVNQAKLLASGVWPECLSSYFAREFRPLRGIQVAPQEYFPPNLLLISAQTSLIGTQQSSGAYVPRKLFCK